MPAQRDGDIARHPARKVDNLIPDFIAARLQMVPPELKNLLWDPRERIFPAWLSLIDRASAIRTKCIWKAINLYFRQPIADCTLNNPGREFDFFLLSLPGQLLKLVH